MTDEFPQAVIEALGCYVYRLEDPRVDDRFSGTFYIGKGKGNRAFHHARDALADDATANDKLDRIREMLKEELRPRIIIHRHGLDDTTAYHVEAALIDVYGIEQLANEQRGVHTGQGMMSASDAIEFYGAPEANIGDPAMLIKIEREWHGGLTGDQLYERTRRYWKANPQNRRPQPCYVFAVARGIIREVYEIESWETYEDMSQERGDPTRLHPVDGGPGERRVGFHGRVASGMAHYRGLSVRGYQRVGNQNPIKYLNC